MKKFDLTGIIPPVVTPLTEDGKPDIATLETVVNHLVDGGVHGLFALGSTGEVAYLSDDERDLVISTIVKAAAGRVPVLAGAIDLTARRVADVARRAEQLGAAAIVATAPFYAINSPVEIAEHFRHINAAVSVPLLAYDVPVRVHTKLTPSLLLQLGQEGTIVGMKDSSGDDISFRRLLAANFAAGSPLKCFTGHEVVVDGMLLAGADGAVPGLANVDPAGYVRLHEAAARGDWDAARVEQERLNELFEIVFQSVGLSGDAAGVGAFKAAMKARGILGSARMAYPIQSLPEDAVTKVEAIVTEWEARRGAPVNA